MNKNLKLSIVIPVLNEEDNVEILNTRITETLSGKIDYEVIWVDDGSTDKTPQIIEKVSRNKRVKGISLMSRTGQSGAMMAGTDIAKGEYIATIDGDNQNDPKDFIKMLKLIEEEKLDAVFGWRKNRWTGNIIRRVPSLIANKMMKMAFGDYGIHDTGCMVRIVRADILKNIRLYGELHRFLSYLICIEGARFEEIRVNHKEREKGKSKYGIGRTVTVIFDILNVKFLTMRRRTPIQFMGPIALVTYLFGFVSLLFAIFEKIIHNADLTGNPYLLVSIFTLIMGTQFLSFGLLGELILRSYHENGEKKTYLIRKLY